MPQAVPGPDTSPKPSLAERLLRRRFARSRHQAIVFDAVMQLSGPDAVLWRRRLLADGAMLALGADAPDVEFRDWRNHWLFPRDNYWGCAAGRAQSWYQNLTAALAKPEWANVAYSAGVLGHYVADALHPFHTGQSQAENDVHFACDVSCSVLYAHLRSMPVAVPPLTLPDAPSFLPTVLAEGATIANKSYETLLAHFHLDRAVSDPSAGFDPLGQRIMAETLQRQISTVARILQRAFRDSGVKPAREGLFVAATRAVWALPLASVGSAQQRRADRRQVARMFDELKAKGHVEAALPAEEQAKRATYGAEVVAKRERPQVDNVFPLEPRAVSVPRDVSGAEEGDAEIIVLARRRAAIETPRPAPRRVAQDAVRNRQDAPQAVAAEEATPQPNSPASSSAASSSAASSSPAPSLPASSFMGAAATGHAAAAMLLPSSAAGISNFRDRRSAPRADTAASGAVIAGLPDLTAAEAALFIGSGHTTVDAIAAAEPEALCANLLRYAATDAGRAVLQNGVAPDIAAVHRIVTAAREIRAA